MGRELGSIYIKMLGSFHAPAIPFPEDICLKDTPGSVQKDDHCCILISWRKKDWEGLEFYPRNLAVGCLPVLSSLEAFHGSSSVPSKQASPVVSTFLRTRPLPPMRLGHWLAALSAIMSSKPWQYLAHTSFPCRGMGTEKKECTSVFLRHSCRCPWSHTSMSKPLELELLIVRDAQYGCWDQTQASERMVSALNP